MDPLTVFLTLATLARKVDLYHRNKESDRFADAMLSGDYSVFNKSDPKRLDQARKYYVQGYGSRDGSSLFNGYYPSIVDELKGYVSKGGADAPVDSTGHTAGDYTVQFKGNPETGYEAYRGLSGSGNYSEYLGHYDAPDIDLTKSSWSK